MVSWCPIGFDTLAQTLTYINGKSFCGRRRSSFPDKTNPVVVEVIKRKRTTKVKMIPITSTTKSACASTVCVHDAVETFHRSRWECYAHATVVFPINTSHA